MTRETKIGLLVGLAFIIVVGVLIADYSSQSMKPPQAPLADSAQYVRDGSNVLAERRPDPSQSRTQTDEVARQIVFQGQTQGGGIVRFGPGDGGSRELVVREENPIGNGGATGGANPPDNNGGAANPPPGGEGTTTVETVREYKAEPGDHVSRMATKFFGSNTKAHRDLIINANPTLQANPDRVVVGQTYRVPVQRPAPPAGSVTPPPAIPEPTPPAPAPQRLTSYVTKPNDSLWKIAVEQCGSGSLTMVSRIKELNKDVLNNGDLIRPNMTLKVPARN